MASMDPTQPNPTHGMASMDPTQPNPTQPMVWLVLTQPNPTHGMANMDPTQPLATTSALSQSMTWLSSTAWLVMVVEENHVIDWEIAEVFARPDGSKSTLD